MLYQENVIRILTSLLVAHGVERVVACPGSRNAAIVNNFCEEGKVEVYPVTDERSAGFFAIGLSLATDRQPVAVCVTSGSALLNVAPAVAEAYYRHVPLIVVSADRPQEWIDQNVGQTMRQYGALEQYVRCSVNLLPARDDSDWYQGRLVNEAMLAANSGARGPVHINVPLPNPSEMTMGEADSFDRWCQPIALLEPDVCSSQVREQVILPFLTAARPMLVMGQMDLDEWMTPLLDRISERIVVISEPLTYGHARPFAGLMDSLAPSLRPDMVVYMGGSLVCRSVNTALAATDAVVWRVDADGDICTPFKNLHGIVKASPETFLKQLAEDLVAKTPEEGPSSSPADGFIQAWNQAMDSYERGNTRSVDGSRLTSETLVRYFEEQLEDMDYSYQVHVANSSIVRQACRFASGHKVWCNRGVNGIEGSVSTAVGFAAATKDMVFLLTGDLSFFYDQNALWNRHLSGNLRIILINDHHGGIFQHVKGLEQCAHLDDVVAASHHTEARGICTQNDVGYLHAATLEEMYIGVVKLLTEASARPMLLEVDMSNQKSNTF